MKWLNLLILLCVNSYMYAPPVTDIDINMETLEELEIKNKRKILALNRLKAIQAADSAAFSILDKYKRKKTVKQHQAFVNKVQEVADKLDVHFSWLVSVMWHESRLNSKALNSIKAVGLIQFLPTTAKGLGTSTNALYNMSDVKQLDYVYKFYKHAKGKFKEITDLYLYAFFPIAVLNSWPDNKVIAYGKLSAKTIARQNRGLDSNKDGKITVGEFRKESIKYCPKVIHTFKYQQQDVVLDVVPKLH